MSIFECHVLIFQISLAEFIEKDQMFIIAINTNQYYIVKSNIKYKTVIEISYLKIKIGLHI